MRRPGCLPVAVLLGLLVLLPFFLADVMLTALGKLGLSPLASFLAATGIFVGGMVNLPVKRIPREVTVEVVPRGLFGFPGLLPRRETRRTSMVVAVNVGGCLVPTGLAVYQLVRLAGSGLVPLLAGLAAVAVNTAICWWAARPVEGLGIALPALVPALAAALMALVMAPDAGPQVAFAAGVLGPLLGADLLHLDEVTELASGVASIGGAGTFDGIVLSGLVATLLA